MNEHDLISVICPVYGKEPYIESCIESVLSQSYPFWELILVDDESPDKCPEICDRYVAMDDRICCIHQKNKGHSESRNVGLRMAHGQYVMFLDADDFLFDENVLRDMMQHTKERKLDICISELATLTADGKLNPSTFKYLELPYDQLTGLEVLCYMIEKKSYHATMCSRLIRRSLIEENNLFFKKMICDDEEWTPQLFYFAERVGFVKRNGYVIRKLETSVTGRQDEPTFLKKILDRSNVSRQLMEIFNEFPGIQNDQKRTLYHKFYGFTRMAYYSLFHDVNACEHKQIVRIMLENYKKMRPFIQYLKAIDIVSYWIERGRLHVQCGR